MLFCSTEICKVPCSIVWRGDLCWKKFLHQEVSKVLVETATVHIIFQSTLDGVARIIWKCIRYHFKYSKIQWNKSNIECLCDNWISQYFPDEFKEYILKFCLVKSFNHTTHSRTMSSYHISNMTQRPQLSKLRLILLLLGIVDSLSELYS